MDTAELTGIGLSKAVQHLRSWRTPTVKQAVHALSLRRMPSLHEILLKLSEVRFSLTCLSILAEISPITFRRFQEENTPLLNPDDDSIAAPVEETLEAICTVVPINLDSMNMEIFDRGWIDALEPESAGYPMGFDEWYELTSDITEADDVMAIYIFFTALRFGEYSVLADAAEHWGWEIHRPELEGDDDHLDWDLLYAELDKQGLGMFRDAINVCCYCTDNIYFDYNPYDENQMYEMPSFDLDGVRWLADQWIEAQPILENYRQANEMFQNDTELAPRLAEIYCSCIVRKSRSKPRTLVEVFEAEQTELTEQERERVRIRL